MQLKKYMKDQYSFQFRNHKSASHYLIKIQQSIKINRSQYGIRFLTSFSGRLFVLRSSNYHTLDAIFINQMHNKIM